MEKLKIFLFHLLFIFRINRKQKLFAAINLGGLTLGIACCLLVSSFIVSEISFDKFHANANRIYRITSNLTLGGTPNLIATTNAPVAPALVDEFPEVINSVRIFPLKRTPIRYGNDKEFYEDRVYYTEPSFFEIFTFPFLKGNSKTALAAPHSVVLTESSAARYFGTEDPIGKALRFNNQTDYTVTGIVADVPRNSHFVFDFLISYSTLYQESGIEAIEAWPSNFGYYSYILTNGDHSYQELAGKLPGIVEKYIGDTFKKYGASAEYFLQPLTDIHLHSKQYRHDIGVQSDIKNVYIFSVIAVFVLIIACLNFVNLSTARSGTRAIEISVRRLMGAERKTLIWRFLWESVAFSFISFFLAYLLALILLPAVENISGRQLTLSFGELPRLLPALILSSIGVGILSGLYPALILSSFKPISLLRGAFPFSSTKRSFRTVLVLLQFTCSVILIIGTGIVFQQLHFLKDKDLGFNKENVVVIPLTEEKIQNSIEAIKEQLKAYPEVVGVGASSHVPGQTPSGGSYEPEGFENGKTVMLDGMTIDSDYLSTLQMKIVSGRNFSKEFPADPENSILINETAAKEIGWDNPLGRKIKFPGQKEGKTVVGVVQDFFFKSPHKAIRGIYISNSGRPFTALFVRISSENIPLTISRLQQIWKNLNFGQSLNYFFLDESYNQQYQSEERLTKIFTYFTFFAIIIACLGLLGMASFNIEQRIKEIGIRKVMGASLMNVLSLLSRNTFMIVGMAILIATPIAYFIMSKWLQEFDYRINIMPDIFILASILILLIAMLTTGILSIKASATNPVNALRDQ